MLRLPLGLIPKDLAVPLWFEPLAGMKWTVGAAPHSYWLGFNDRQKRRLVAKLTPKQGRVWDIGANVGYYSLIFSRWVGPKGQVVAFEPSPRNLTHLHHHLAVNKVGNVQVFPYAVGKEKGEVYFADAGDPVGLRIVNESTLKVPMVSLDELFAAGQLVEPQVIKIDVEGAELMVLQGARGVLERFHPVIFLETHDRFEAGLHQACEALLKECGYRWVVSYGGDHPPTEILALRDMPQDPQLRSLVEKS